MKAVLAPLSGHTNPRRGRNGQQQCKQCLHATPVASKPRCRCMKLRFWGVVSACRCMLAGTMWLGNRGRVSHMLALLTTFFRALIVDPFLSLTPVTRLPSKVTWLTWAFSSNLPPCFFTPLQAATDDRQHQNSSVTRRLAGWQLSCTQSYHSCAQQGGILHAREILFRPCQKYCTVLRSPQSHTKLRCVQEHRRRSRTQHDIRPQPLTPRSQRCR